MAGLDGLQVLGMLIYLLCILEKVYKIFFLYSTFIVIGKLMIYCFSWNRRDRLALMRNTVLIGEAWTCGHE